MPRLYSYTDGDGDRFVVDDSSLAGAWVHVNQETANVPADERRAAAQAVAGPDYRVVPRDLTVGDLQQIARDAGVKLDMDVQFPADIRERCPACNHEPDRPEPVDPASVRVGDVVDYERKDDYRPRRIVGEVQDIAFEGDSIQLHDQWWNTNKNMATVRILHAAEPEPDEASVEALAEALNAVGGHAPAWPDLVPSNQEHYRARARALIRDHGVHVEVPTNE